MSWENLTKIAELYDKLKTDDNTNLNELERTVVDKEDPNEMIKALQLGFQDAGIVKTKELSALLVEKCTDFIKLTMPTAKAKEITEKMKIALNAKVTKQLKDKKYTLRDW